MLEVSSQPDLSYPSNKANSPSAFPLGTLQGLARRVHVPLRPRCACQRFSVFCRDWRRRSDHGLPAQCATPMDGEPGQTSRRCTAATRPRLHGRRRDLFRSPDRVQGLGSSEQGRLPRDFAPHHAAKVCRRPGEPRPRWRRRRFGSHPPRVPAARQVGESAPATTARNAPASDRSAVSSAGATASERCRAFSTTASVGIAAAVLARLESEGEWQQ